MKNERQIEFDVLRIISMYFVMLTHVCGMEVHNILVDSFDGIVLNCLMAAVTWDVPIFIMISGRFFLDSSKEMTTAKIYKKYIMRLVAPFIFWSVMMNILYIYNDYKMTGVISLNWKMYLVNIITGPYHLWFVFMICGLYIATPILRKISEDKKTTKYWIMLSIIFLSLKIYGVKLPLIGETISLILGKMNFEIVLGFSVYYLLGYYVYIYKDEISVNVQRGLYFLSLLLIIFSCIATTVHSIHCGKTNEFFSVYQSPNVIICSIGIYLWGLNCIHSGMFSDSIKKVIFKLSEHSMGMYFAHAIVLEVVFLLTGIKPTYISVLIMPFVITTLLYIICFLLVAFMSKIPLLRKVVR
jgi:surface polysaccharide O-acyltransferase-like enzyme